MPAHLGLTVERTSAAVVPKMKQIHGRAVAIVAIVAAIVTVVVAVVAAAGERTSPHFPVTSRSSFLTSLHSNVSSV